LSIARNLRVSRIETNVHFQIDLTDVYRMFVDIKSNVTLDTKLYKLMSGSVVIHTFIQM
jgi:hypothetical protein